MTHEEWQAKCEEVIKEDAVFKLLTLHRYADDFLDYLEEKYQFNFDNEAIDWIEKTANGNKFLREELDRVIDAVPENDEP